MNLLFVVVVYAGTCKKMKKKQKKTWSYFSLWFIFGEKSFPQSDVDDKIVIKKIVFNLEKKKSPIS